MEETERRRERLKALRLEAQQEPDRVGAEVAVLPSPLLPEPSDSSSGRVPSFDYYTDPLAVYAGSKRKAGGMQPKSPQRITVPTSGTVHQPLRAPVPAWNETPYNATQVMTAASHATFRGVPPRPYGYPRPSYLHYPRWGQGSGPEDQARGRSFRRQGGHPSRTNGMPHVGETAVSAEQHPELFYSKSMVEDPWRDP